MPDLEPITREEMLWSGEDLEPKTRREMYIKHLYDETQVIPDKPITREEMFILKAGEELHDVTIEQLSVTENGTYSESGKAYSPVIVNVPQTTLTTLDVTENGTYTAPSGTAYDEVDVNVPLPENAYLLKDIPNTPASIATFTDGAPLPMPKLEIAVEPQQDLHGYDNPWVGGAGKNKVDIADTTAGTTEINKTNLGLQQDNYVLTFDLENASYQNSTAAMWDFYDLDGTNFAYPTPGYIYRLSDNRSISSLEQPISGRFYFKISNHSINRIRLYFITNSMGQWSGKIKNVMLEKGTTATTFAPYSNICPISGWDEGNVVVSPTTDAEDGHTYTIPFQDAQGNPIEVYGGKLDVVSGGEQPNKYVKKTLYDAWSVASNGVFYLDGKATDGKVGAVNTEADVLCDIYPKGICVGATSGAIQNPKTLCIQDLNGIRFMVYDTSFESLEDFNEYVAQNGIEIRYELATPSTFYTQPTSISSQSGVNNIWADCGDIIDGQYFGKEV